MPRLLLILRLLLIFLHHGVQLLLALVLLLVLLLLLRRRRRRRPGARPFLPLLRMHIDPLASARPVGALRGRHLCDTKQICK